MGLRIYFCPIVGDGLTPQTAFRAKLSGIAPSVAAVIPHAPDGKPKFTFAPCIARSADWSTADADAALERMFGIDLPDTIDTFADLKAFLQSKTVADIPAARRQALNTRLTNHGLDTSQVTLSTTWWQVLKGIYQQLGNPPGDGPQV